MKYNVFTLITASVFLLISSTIGINAQGNEIKYQEEDLENGLHVIYNIDRSAPVVSTVLHYKVGSKDENPNKTGYAHFFEHLMFEATEDIPSEQIDKYVNQAGGNLNASTSLDETVYNFTLPSNQLKLALWIEASRMRKLLIDSSGVETQRGVVKEERNVRVDNQPYGDFLQNMQENLFGGSGYGWATIGYHEHLDKAQISDFKSFYDRYYQPNNACLVISGDINISEAKEYVHEYFGNIPKGPEIDRREFNLPPLEEEVDKEIKDEKAQLPAVFIGYRGPKIGTDDYYTMNMLSNIMASGESSRLYRKLVDEKQLAATTQMIPLSLQHSGALVFLGVPNPGNDVDDVRSAILDEIDRVIENGVTEDELRKAKNIREANAVSSNKNTMTKARSLARYWSYFNDPGMINKEIEKYLEVTKEDIKSVAKKYLDTDKRVILTYIPTSQ